MLRPGERVPWIVAKKKTEGESTRCLVSDRAFRSLGVGVCGCGCARVCKPQTHRFRCNASFALMSHNSLQFSFSYTILY